MPIKPKYSLLLCFVLFSLLLSAQETAPLRKNHFGFGASWQTQPLDYDNGKGLGLKLRYERGKRGIRFLSEIGTERMRYTAFKSSGESSHDIGWGSHSWRKTESHDLLVYSNTFAIGSVLRTQNKKRFKVGIGLKFGYHQKMHRKFLSESCTMQYFRRRSWPVWQSSSFIESPIYECDAKKSVILKIPFLHPMNCTLVGYSKIDLNWTLFLTPSLPVKIFIHSSTLIQMTGKTGH